MKRQMCVCAAATHCTGGRAARVGFPLQRSGELALPSTKKPAAGLLNALPAPAGGFRTDQLCSSEIDDEMVSVERGNLANQIGPHVAA